MSNNIKKEKITGYIEGFYGRLLSWDSRKLLIQKLKLNNMNTYFYAPKEDVFHRLKWKEKYNHDWRNSFKNFANYSKLNNINVIVGIAPGLDFNFKEFINNNDSQNYDFNILLKKARQILEDGADSIGLMLDDIPNNFYKKYGKHINEGQAHGILANKLSKELERTIYLVPRIYADELIEQSPDYLNNLSKVLDTKTKLFYCGDNIVSRKLVKKTNTLKAFHNEIIFWDNYYSNDYCPRRFFVGPYKGRQNIKNIMINPTGLIKTDLLILDIVGSSVNHKISLKSWKKIISQHGVPSIFYKLRRFFSEPNFGNNPLLDSFKVNNKYIEAIDFLLWKWKSELSREWYPYLFGLKHDIQLYQKSLTSERCIKTQTLPMSRYIQSNTGELK